MRFFNISVVLAFAGLAAAQSGSAAIPQCAMPCFEQAIGNTTCGLTDYYCQCTKGKDTITKVATKCLCTSDCSTTELLQAVQASNKICAAALSASSQPFTPATVGLNACQTGSTATASTGLATASASTTGSAASGSASGSASASGSGSGSASAASASASGAAATAFLGYDGMMLGLAGAALLAL